MSITAADPYVTPDERDEQILAGRMAKLNDVAGPRVGDFVVFSDGVERRFSYDWDEMGLQTTDGGSFHLGDGFVSFSGSLHPPVLRDTLTDTGETKDGSVWFFHHDWWQAHHAVYASAPFRVFACSLRSDERSR